jgi:hypothetical protein
MENRPMKLPKLHLRDVFWLVLVCALVVGWWGDRGRVSAELSKVMRAIIRSPLCLDRVGDEYELIRCGKLPGTAYQLPRPESD